MLIDLKAIDEDGQEFTFDNKSDEVLDAFTDLIGKNPFKIEIEIKPMGNTYQVVGRLDSHYTEKCSSCGFEIDVPLNNKINEIVVIEKTRPRNTQVSQSQQNFDSSGPAVTYINETNFDVKEFLHEMMASGFSLYPRCTDTDLCEGRQFKAVDMDDEPTQKANSAFDALKDFKIKH